MKSKTILFSLFLVTVLCVTHFKAIALSEVTQDRVIHTAQNQSLNARISRIETGLVPESDESESTDAQFKLLERMEFYKTPGVSVAVIDRGKIDWTRGYGVRQTGENKSVNTETLFQAASISKPVTAMGVLKLVQSGELNLDEDVNQKLVSWQIPDSRFTEKEKVTLRNLLSHTASITVHGFEGYSADEEVPTTLQILNGEAPANSDQIKVDGELNREFRYSGGGYVVIQQLLLDIMGKPFSTLMQETVLDQLGMTNSTYQQPLPDSKVAVAATGHDDQGNAIAGAWHTYPEMAAAGLWATPSDLARLAIAIQQSASGKPDSYLAQTTANEMLTPQVEGWGLGFELPKGKSVRFAHGGSNFGFQCLLVADKNTGQGAVVMTNSDQGLPLAIEIINSIATEYGWRDRLSSQPS
jgi:CubicO group peptidase (beta-lactamase class C family)